MLDLGMGKELEHIKKLNEELTAENIRLLTELDGVNDRADAFKEVATECAIELSAIKSTFWYKLINWKW